MSISQKIRSRIPTPICRLLKAFQWALLLAAVCAPGLANRHKDLTDDIKKRCDFTVKSYDPSNCQAIIFTASEEFKGSKAKASLALLRAPEPEKRLGALIYALGFSTEPAEACMKDLNYSAKHDVWKPSKSQRYNMETIAEIWDSGYDIYVLDWCDKSTWIQRNAYALIDAMKTVRNGDFPAGVEALNEDEAFVVMGGSMGGLITRYALAKLEDQGIHHGADLYISFDGPQQGALLPIGIQHLAAFLEIGPETAAAVVRLYNEIRDKSTDPNSPLETRLRELRGAKTPAARQMLLVHKDGPRSSGPTGDFEDLFAELDDIGYPHAPGLRTVAIANGSGGGVWTGPPARTLRLSSNDSYKKTLKIQYPADAAGTLLDPILWKATLDVRIPAFFDLIVAPLTETDTNQTVFEARLNTPGIYVNDVFIKLSNKIDVGVLSDILDLPKELPEALILSPFVHAVQNFVNTTFGETVLFKVERSANVPVAYGVVPAGTGRKFQETIDGLSALHAIGGMDAEPFIPTTSALGLNRKKYPADTNVAALVEAGTLETPFDQIYYHDKETSHVDVTDKVATWLCDEVSRVTVNPYGTSLSPNRRPVGAAKFDLTLSGENLHEGLVLVWNNPSTGEVVDLPTNFVNGTLVAKVDSDLIDKLPPCVGGYCNPLFPEFEPVLITIKDTKTGLLKCHSLPFTIEEERVTSTPATPLSSDPFTLTLSDDWRDGCVPKLSAGKGEPAYTLEGNTITILTDTDYGDGFCLFFIAPYEVKVEIDPLPADSYEVVYYVDEAFGGTKELARSPIIVRPGRPMISTLEPPFAEAGSSNLNLTISGTDFKPDTLAMWKGSSYPTNFVDQHTLMTQIPAQDLSMPGEFEITVETPDDAGGFASDPKVFTVTPPATSLTRISPAEIPAAIGQTTITMIGEGFTQDSRGAWPTGDDTAQLLETTYLGSTLIEVTIPASLSSIPGALPLFVKTNDAETETLTLFIRATEPIVGDLPQVTSVGDGATFRPVVTPLSWASVFGANFTDGEYFAESVPLPFELGGVKVTVNGYLAAINYASPTQINFQVSQDVLTGEVAKVVVIRNGLPGELFEIPVQENAFGLFQYYRGDVLDPILVNLDGQIVSPDSPVSAGDVVVGYGTGVDSVNNPPADGAASPSDPPSTCSITPSAVLRTAQGSVPVEVLYCGFTANFLSLVQLNLKIMTIPPGANPKLYIRFGEGPESAGATIYTAP